eukprot:11452582-Alexandrium_andersonii.AAC.1
MSTSSGASKVGAQMSKATAVQKFAFLKAETPQRRLSNGGAANAARPPKRVTCTSADSGLSQLQ